jgi:hypothetical protein
LIVVEGDVDRETTFLRKPKLVKGEQHRFAHATVCSIAQQRSVFAFCASITPFFPDLFEGHECSFPQIDWDFVNLTAITCNHAQDLATKGAAQDWEADTIFGTTGSKIVCKLAHISKLDDGSS